MKAHNRYSISRMWLSASAVLLGVLAGYFVGRESILHSVNSRLGEYADRVLQHDVDLGREVVNTLLLANSASAPVCSELDIELLRQLTFAARFLKDVSRVHENTVLCSAVSGRVTGTLPSVAPDLALPDGYRIYRNFPLSVPAGDHAEVIGREDTEVVLGPDIFSDFGQQPIHYFVGVVDPAWLDRNGPAGSTLAGNRLIPARPGDTRPVTLSGVMGVAAFPNAVLTAQNSVRVGDSIYRARCSDSLPICAVTSIPIQEMWSADRNLMAGYVATGGAAGASCAVALLLAGRKRRSQTSQLKRAILMGKLSVAYQPIVELGTHRIVGAEALARWTDENGDSIRPETIIALAEAEGFVSEITRFVITRSLAELVPVFAENPEFRLNINLAPSDLADPRLLLLLDESLENSLISPGNLTFELTERATSDKEVAVAAIRRLRQRGHAVFIDDFGTGYSNLAYLTELNVDGIKINRSFIATLGTDSVTASIVPQILAVAKAFGLLVVVQGIEREEQAKYFALDDPFILGQGWFFGQPIPARSLQYLCTEKSE